MIASPRALRPAGARRPKADAPSLREAASSAGPLSEVCHGLCQCVDLGADAIPCPLSFLLPFSGSLSVALCLPLSVSPSPCVPARSCLSVCLSVCICLAPPWECVSEPSSLSVSVSPDPRPPTGAMAVALAAALAPAGCLTWRGCLRVSVCLSVCLHVARPLPQEGAVLGGRRGGKGGLGRAKGRG